MYLLQVGSAVKLAQPFLFITLRLREAPPSAARSAPRRCYRTAWGSWGFRSFLLFCRCALPLRLGSLYWPGAAASSSTAAPATAEVPQKKASIDVNFLRRFSHLAQKLRKNCHKRVAPFLWPPPAAPAPTQSGAAGVSPHTAPSQKCKGSACGLQPLPFVCGAVGDPSPAAALCGRAIQTRRTLRAARWRGRPPPFVFRPAPRARGRPVAALSLGPPLKTAARGLARCAAPLGPCGRKGRKVNGLAAVRCRCLLVAALPAAAPLRSAAAFAFRYDSVMSFRRIIVPLLIVLTNYMCLCQLQRLYQVL